MNETIVTYFLQFNGFQELINSTSKFFGFGTLTTVSFFIFLVSTVIALLIISLIGGLGTYAERKISADIQMRIGPNRVGPYGILQFLADGIKMITKEDIIQNKSDKFIFILAPVLAVVGVVSTFAVIPFSSGFTITDLNIGILYVLGISSLVGIAIFLGGYASNSKWSMLGGMRGASQIISYEIPVTLSILSIILLSGSMSMKSLVGVQSFSPFSWYLLHNPFTFIGFFVYFISILAETNRAPFDLPEAESELVSGYHTEYTGMRFAFFALAEYMEVFVLCAIAVSIYLGGYNLPESLQNGELLINNAGLSETFSKNIVQILQVILFFIKTFILYYIVIWVRWTFPRLRIDQLMSLCWKYLIPISLFNFIGCALWMYFFNDKSVIDLIFKS